MHLSPAAIESAIRLLDVPGSLPTVETWWQRDLARSLTPIASVTKLAGSTGLEPAASAVTGLRSSQLNYDPNRTDADIADFKLQTSDWIADCVTSICDLKSTI